MDENVIAEMKDPESGVRFEVRYVTPEWARSVLEREGQKNRRLSDKVAAEYAADMKAGEFPFIGDSVRFDWFGNVLDGQHRLDAVVRSGVTVKMEIIYDLDPKLQDYMDQGFKRTVAQILGLHGESRTSTLGSVLSRVVLWNRGLVDARGVAGVTRHQILDLLDGPNVDLMREAVEAATKAKASLPVSNRTHRRILTPAIFGFAYYLCATQSPEDAREFFKRLATGEGMAFGDPAYLLREKTLQNLVPSISSTDTQTRQLALIFKAWNAYRRDEAVQVLKYLPGEKFPQPV